VHKEGPEGKLNPRFFGDHDQQKISAGFDYTCSFGERLTNPLAIEVIDCIRADHRIKRAGVERKFPHISRFDCGPFIYTRSLQVFQQPLLRTLTAPEMRIERLSEEIQRNESRLTAGFEDHNGRPTRTRPYIQHPSSARTKEALRRQRRPPIDVENKARHHKSSA